MKRYLRWEGVDDNTLEHCEFEQSADGFTVHSNITGTMDGKPVTFRYYIRLDTSWTVREFFAENLSDKNPFLIHALHQSPGKWLDKNGSPLPQFDGCIDIDIFPTPFTNSLPLKREPIHIGQHSEFNALWVDLREGVARKARQRYSRLSEFKFQFKSLDTGFTETIEFTSDFFVAHYPGLFRLKS